MLANFCNDCLTNIVLKPNIRIMDYDNDFVVSLPCNILFFKHEIIWDLNDHIAAAIYLEAFNFVIPRMPVDRSLDWKGSLTIAFKVILFLKTILRKKRLERFHCFRTSPYDFFIKGKLFFFSNSGRTDLRAVI